MILVPITVTISICISCLVLAKDFQNQLLNCLGLLILTIFIIDSKTGT